MKKAFQRKQIVKENVKAALSENKQVISLAFTALLQTLTSDPQMLSIIYRILTANDCEQHKDNNNIGTKYLQANKNKILDLVEKNYENLVGVLTNNTIDTVSSSPTSVSSLPQSSSTFPNSFDQNDIYREESEALIIVKAILLIDFITATLTPELPITQ